MNRDTSTHDELPSVPRELVRVDDLSGSGWSSSELSTPLQRSRILNESQSPARSSSPSLTSLSDIEGLEHALGDLKTWVQEESKLSELAESLPAEILAQVGEVVLHTLMSRYCNMSFPETLCLPCSYPSLGAWQLFICYGRSQSLRASLSLPTSSGSSRAPRPSCRMPRPSVVYHSTAFQSIFPIDSSGTLWPARIWRGSRCRGRPTSLRLLCVRCSPTSRN